VGDGDKAARLGGDGQWAPILHHTTGPCCTGDPLYRVGPALHSCMRILLPLSKSFSRHFVFPPGVSCDVSRSISNESNLKLHLDSLLRLLLISHMAPSHLQVQTEENER
jgi:hypothetical protein